MTLRKIAQIGHPILRERAREVSREELEAAIEADAENFGSAHLHDHDHGDHGHVHGDGGHQH